MIKRLTFLGFLFLLSFNLAADGSFRLKSGKLISTGITVSELYRLAGHPNSKETLKDSDGESATKREVFIYELEGSVGGEYFVTVELDDGAVVSVTSKQIGRM